MRIKSWEQVDLDYVRAIVFTAAVGASLFVLVSLVGLELRIGSVAIVLGAITAAATCYLISTAPRRMLNMAAFRQTLDAPSLAAASNIYLKSTSSRSKTFLMLRAEEPNLRAFLAQVRRRVLLGYDASAAVQGALPGKHVFSESVKTVLDSAVGVERARIEEGAEELDGILNSASLDDETKLPLLIAVAFFLPIMLILFTAMTKGTGPETIGALVALEVIVLDITLALTRTSAGWTKGGARRRGLRS